jgi:6-phosphofructokinase 1
MVSIVRDNNTPYRIHFSTAPLNEVAVKAKPMPDSFITSRGNYPSQEFIDYCKPLISDLPEFVRLEKKMVGEGSDE